MRLIIECPEEIPCDPCGTACPRQAIAVGPPLTARPALDEEKCTGCGACIPACPGLAIFLLDESYSETEAKLDFPFEFLPLPMPGETATAVDRSGRPVAEARVLGVRSPRPYDKTTVVSIAFPKELADEVRGIAIK